MEWRLSQTAQGNIKSLLLISCLAIGAYFIFTLGKYSNISPIIIYTSLYLLFRLIGLCKINAKYENYKFYSSLFWIIFSTYAFYKFDADNYPMLNFLYFFFGIGLHVPLSLELALGFYRRRR